MGKETGGTYYDELGDEQDADIPKGVNGTEYFIVVD